MWGFLAGYIICLTILTLIFGRMELFVTLMGYVALGLESTLPIPQMIRMVYFFLQGSPLQFKVCAIFQLSIDFSESAVGFSSVCLLVDDDDLEQALALAEE
ncbi:hypothetical protein HETIRDRAFT_445771 [Heterobasidion irregulare TC 32-1]|uniref:Uncharacterized protein n=1 Tax=Heterobasidion irregulare (strain TC 32-1) TaxID=747525 RepID=W4JZD6_HETIT|nr:uncharacterized protein HETIRDRAFT_445771 [Heterobasidion irregulare TC 32-1]ETW78938.1 hypothetical protein HETIRDRAFT_445771 [Heterobasidion irregulare TC 32-1]